MKNTTRSPAARRRFWRQQFTGLAFLGPNIIGFMVFTLVPLVFSLILAFTNWDIRFHNMFKEESVRFVGFANFQRLFQEPDFLRYLGNTLFLMINIPLAIAGSLGAALLLVKDTRGGSRRVWGTVIATAVLTASVLLLWAHGARGTAMTMLFAGLFGLFLVGGTIGGVSVYRTLFYIPSFTSGVAVYLLWKKMYSDIGPINTSLARPLENLGTAVNNTPQSIFTIWIAGALVLLMSWLAVSMVRRLARQWREGDTGTCAVLIPSLLAFFPCAFPLIHTFSTLASSQAREKGLAFSDVFVPVYSIPLLVLIAAFIWQLVLSLRKGQSYPAAPWKGSGDALIFSLLGMTGLFVLLGLAIAVHNLPANAAAGLAPPKWLTDYNWAKPAIMIMGLWGAIGSNNMILYIAGLTNIPPELYEAADIDGASSSQRFWHITWPQLAPITFFIFIMSVIGGLQGGFEMARTMTKGGPAGATTTLSYFIYTQGFETGRFGSASGVAWALFAMVLGVTLINWKFGSRYVND